MTENDNSQTSLQHTSGQWTLQIWSHRLTWPLPALVDYNCSLLRLGSFMSNGRQILTLQLPKLFQLIMHNDASKPHTRWPNNNVNTAFVLLIQVQTYARLQE